jgi:hypothetical protein
VIGLSLQCGNCIHLRDPVTDPPKDGVEGATHPLCDAFPALPGIPDEIWQLRFDHRQPHEGDHGVRWEPIEPGVPHPMDSPQEVA